MAHFLEDCPQWTIPNSGGWTLQGHSSAGERTGFHIPELRLFLDAGVNSYRDVAALLLTHGHNDHSHNIPCLVMGHNGQIDQRPPIYCHKAIVNPVRLLARASQALNDSMPLADRDEVNAHGVGPGDTFELQVGRQRNLTVDVRAVQCDHCVPCLGWIISKRSNRLRPELQGLKSSEIAARRKAGEQVSEIVSQPVFAFMGDTTEAALNSELNPGLLDVPVIVVECTSVGKAGGPEPDKCRERKHMHWENLRPIVKQNPQTTFVLIHFSRAIDQAAAVREIAEAGLLNLVLWFESGPVMLQEVLAKDAKDLGQTASQ